MQYSEYISMYSKFNIQDCCKYIKIQRIKVKDHRLTVQLQRNMAAEIEAKVICANGEQRASWALKEADYVMCESHVSEKIHLLLTLNTISAEKKFYYFPFAHWPFAKFCVQIQIKIWKPRMWLAVNTEKLPTSPATKPVLELLWILSVRPKGMSCGPGSTLPLYTTAQAHTPSLERSFQSQHHRTEFWPNMVLPLSHKVKGSLQQLLLLLQ